LQKSHSRNSSATAVSQLVVPHGQSQWKKPSYLTVSTSTPMNVGHNRNNSAPAALDSPVHSSSYNGPNQSSGKDLLKSFREQRNPSPGPVAQLPQEGACRSSDEEHHGEASNVNSARNIFGVKLRSVNAKSHENDESKGDHDHGAPHSNMTKSPNQWKSPLKNHNEQKQGNVQSQNQESWNKKQWNGADNGMLENQEVVEPSNIYRQPTPENLIASVDEQQNNQELYMEKQYEGDRQEHEHYGQRQDGHEQFGQGQYGQDQYTQANYEHEHYAQEQYTPEQYTPEQYEQEQYEQEQYTPEHYDQGQLTQENYEQEQHAQEHYQEQDEQEQYTQEYYEQEHYMHEQNDHNGNEQNEHEQYEPQQYDHEQHQQHHEEHFDEQDEQEEWETEEESSSPANGKNQYQHGSIEEHVSISKRWPPVKNTDGHFPDNEQPMSTHAPLQSPQNSQCSTHIGNMKQSSPSRQNIPPHYARGEFATQTQSGDNDREHAKKQYQNYTDDNLDHVQDDSNDEATMQNQIHTPSPKNLQDVEPEYQGSNNDGSTPHYQSPSSYRKNKTQSTLPSAQESVASPDTPNHSHHSTQNYSQSSLVAVSSSNTGDDSSVKSQKSHQSFVARLRNVTDRHRDADDASATSSSTTRSKVYGLANRPTSTSNRMAGVTRTDDSLQTTTTPRQNDIAPYQRMPYQELRSPMMKQMAINQGVQRLSLKEIDDQLNQSDHDGHLDGSEHGYDDGAYGENDRWRNGIEQDPPNVAGHQTASHQAPYGLHSKLMNRNTTEGEEEDRVESPNSEDQEKDIQEQEWLSSVSPGYALFQQKARQGYMMSTSSPNTSVMGAGEPEKGSNENVAEITKQENKSIYAGRMYSSLKRSTSPAECQEESAGHSEEFEQWRDDRQTFADSSSLREDSNFDTDNDDHQNYGTVNDDTSDNYSNPDNQDNYDQRNEDAERIRPTSTSPAPVTPSRVTVVTSKSPLAAARLGRRHRAHTVLMKRKQTSVFARATTPTPLQSPRRNTEQSQSTSHSSVSQSNDLSNQAMSRTLSMDSSESSNGTATGVNRYNTAFLRRKRSVFARPLRENVAEVPQQQEDYNNDDKNDKYPTVTTPLSTRSNNSSTPLDNARMFRRSLALRKNIREVNQQPIQQQHNNDINNDHSQRLSSPPPLQPQSPTAGGGSLSPSYQGLTWREKIERRNKTRSKYLNSPRGPN